jgi:hypothetical protein
VSAIRCYVCLPLRLTGPGNRPLRVCPALRCRERGAVHPIKTFGFPGGYDRNESVATSRRASALSAPMGPFVHIY